MNGGSLPMLGGPESQPGRQNAGVKKALTPFRSRDSRGQTGFTLIEVMVALMVLVLGVLGAAAMTLSALRDGKQAGLRTQATALAYEASEMVRWAGPANETIFTAGTTLAVTTCWTTSCSVSDMAKNDLNEWMIKVAAQLPNGTARICRDKTNLTSFTLCDNLATSPVVVKLRWDEKNNATAQGTFGTQNFTSAVNSVVLSVPITTNY
jgi:type IV pilus assembly protein PilV